MSATDRKPSHPWEVGWKWFENAWDLTFRPCVEALQEAQAAIVRERGLIMACVRVNPESAQYLMLRDMLIRGRGDRMGEMDWPEGAHVAIPLPLHPIAIVVDPSLGAQEALLVGHGHQQRMRLAS